VNIKKIISSLVIILFLIFSAPLAFAVDIPSGGTPVDGGAGVHIPTATETGLADTSIQDVLTNLLQWLLGIVGIIALIGFAISGIQYILASGDEKLAETAKKNMVNSVMGIVVVLASFVVIQAIDMALRGSGSF